MDRRERSFAGSHVKRLAAQMESVYMPRRKIQLYHSDNRGLTNKLLFKAMAICTNNAWRASPFSLKPGMHGYSY
ncbi:MAG: hypothetical protein EGQ02_07475 [Enterobacter cloacae]|nr:hypothetical protein [Enterobacter cloacae]